MFSFRKSLPRLAASGLAFAVLAGCLREDKVAGGSSGVDNPKLVVAFVGDSGLATPVSGTLSVFLADQNPASDPAPLVRKKIRGDTATLSALDFKGDSARAYNLLFVSEDSTGSLVRGLAYDPVARQFRLGDATASTRIDVKPVPLVSYEARLEREGSELVRVVAPGTPYQAVVVDSVFILTGIPGDDTLTLHLMGVDGSERPLKASQEGVEGDKPRHRVDSEAAPIRRPPPPEPSGTLRVNAGLDRSVILGSEFGLLGGVEGATQDDPRLAVLWRQIDPNPMFARATLRKPYSLQTTVTVPWPGQYRFALSAVFGNHRVEDTVTISVQSPPPAPVFIEPNAVNYFSQVATVGGAAFRVNWYSYVLDTLDVQLSRDSGGTWATLYEDVISYGPVDRWWTATSPVAENCLLRLRRQNGDVAAVSTRFAIRATTSKLAR